MVCQDWPVFFRSSDSSSHPSDHRFHLCALTMVESYYQMDKVLKGGVDVMYLMKVGPCITAYLFIVITTALKHHPVKTMSLVCCSLKTRLL